MLTRDKIRDVDIIDCTVKINLKKRLKPYKIKVKQTLLKLRLKRWSIYKNAVGSRDYNFKPTYYSQLCEELILLKYKLVELRDDIIKLKKLNDNFNFSLLKFIVSNKFYNMKNFSYMSIWKNEISYRKLKINRNNSLSSYLRYSSFITKLQKI